MNLVASKTALTSLGLSTRTLQALRRVGIITVDDALKMLEQARRSPQLHIPNFGEKARDELVAKLRQKGYTAE